MDTQLWSPYHAHPMGRGLRRSIAILVLIVISGGHWPALQGVAWITMLVSNFRTCSISDAMSHTFDGRHPCPLCKAIASAKKTEKTSQLVVPATRLEFVLSPARFSLDEEFCCDRSAPACSFAAELTPQPPTPPPRSIPA